MELYQEIEKAFGTRYRKNIWRPFMSAIKEYALVSEGDRIAVCISGGKDSVLLAKCMQELKRHSPLNFELVFLCMDPGYAPENRKRIEENAALLHIPIEFFDTDVFAAVEAMGGSPCHMCAKMRRGYLYRRAKELGCNKIALGHHFDDAVETVLMSMIYTGQLRGMRPRLASDNVPGMELIRPLYKVHERDIIDWRDHFGLKFLDCACMKTRDMKVSGEHSDSKRQEMKLLLLHLNALNPDAAKNIFRSAHNVVLDSLNAWKHQDKEFSMLEEFDHDD